MKKIKISISKGMFKFKIDKEKMKLFFKSRSKLIIVIIVAASILGIGSYYIIYNNMKSKTPNITTPKNTSTNISTSDNSNKSGSQTPPVTSPTPEPISPESDYKVDKEFLNVMKNSKVYTTKSSKSNPFNEIYSDDSNAYKKSTLLPKEQGVNGSGTSSANTPSSTTNGANGNTTTNNTQNSTSGTTNTSTSGTNSSSNTGSNIKVTSPTSNNTQVKVNGQ